jgi:hypothetical protein
MLNSSIFYYARPDHQILFNLYFIFSIWEYSQGFRCYRTHTALKNWKIEFSDTCYTTANTEPDLYIESRKEN